jgi:hypothetical protein
MAMRSPNASLCSTPPLMRVVSLFVMLLLAVPAGAVEIYKWIDERGEVHYSTTPPADAFSEARRVGPSGLLVDDEGALQVQRARSTLEGEWRSYVDGVEQRLNLLADDMRFSWTAIADDAGDEPEVRFRGAGEWGELNEALLLTYAPDPWSGSPNAGRILEFRIVENSSSQLTMVAEDGRTYRFVRADAFGVRAVGRLTGIWVNDASGEHLRFQGQRFSLNFAPRTNWQPQVFGDWNLEDGVLTLRYAASTIERFEPGGSDAFHLEYVDEVRLILRRTEGDEWVRFQRP